MAYTLVVSLKQTMKRLLNQPSQSVVIFPRSEMELIYEDLCYVKSFFDRISSLQSNQRVEPLEKQIKYVVQKLQDLIESYVSDQFRSGSETSGDESLTVAAFSQQLMEVKPQLSVFTEMFKTKEEYNFNTEDDQSSYVLAAEDAVSSRIDSGGTHQNQLMVGFDRLRIELMDWLSGHSYLLNIMSVVGMAGIGKTTLARSVYDDPFIIEHFDLRLFVSIGPQYLLKEFLVLALDQLGHHIEKMRAKDDEELASYLYRSLKGRRYLIVLDDIWHADVWDELGRCFPDDGNGSRIMLTSRLVNVAPFNILQMPFLSEDQSWNLLCKIVFDEEMCPPELELIGKMIVKTCHGLPLVIILIGSLLRKTYRTVANWKEVAKNVNSFTTAEYGDSSISKILSLSYKQLPQHLKACFLYMGVFPQNYEIPASELIKLWVSEGLFRPQRVKSLEEMARECLDDLVSRSLVFSLKRSSRGRIKTCRIHSVFRDLCVREAQSEKFFHVISKHGDSFPEGINNQRRLCIYDNVVLGIEQAHSSMKSASAARSLLYFGQQHQNPLRVHVGPILLRVLHAPMLNFYKFPHEVLKLDRLKYLAISFDGELPASISKLWNLEVLIVHQRHNIKFSDTPLYLPLEIWKLCSLRHLQCKGFYLPDPLDDSLILKNLLTLSGVSVDNCMEAFVVRMPNLTKLDIQIKSEHYAFDCVAMLHHLESFKCIVLNSGLGSIPSFPANVRKITLSGCGFSWEYMTCIGSLPFLEVLKLRRYAFRGPEWETIEGEFMRLKFLLLEDMDIEQWTTDSYNFPVLEDLVIRRCYKLEEIPCGIGDIPTLRMMELMDCSKSVVNSAENILEEQREMGNDELQLQIRFSRDEY